MTHRPRLLELFAGIGGCALAVQDRATIRCAVDISPLACRVYQLNFSHSINQGHVEHLPEAFWQAHEADAWWMSPPCQPFTKRGQQRDWEDSRNLGFKAVLHRIEQFRPSAVLLENVPGFVGSYTHAQLHHLLQRCGYALREFLLCPTDFGIPNRRRRFYLVATRGIRVQHPNVTTEHHVALADCLDLEPSDPGLWIEREIEQTYARAIHVIGAEETEAITTCFTSAYGRSWVRSGAYLRTPQGLRRFSPREVARLLGYPNSFRLPANYSNQQLWRLLGNSLSIPVVRYVIAPVLAALTGE